MYDQIFMEILRKLSPVFNGKTYFIPQPRLSFEERDRRRLAFRNEHRMYKRKSSFSGVAMISVFHDDPPDVQTDDSYKIFTRDEWWDDSWDPLTYGVDYDFGPHDSSVNNFFDQFAKLQLKVPRPPLINNKSENSDYCNFSDWNKSCYLMTSSNRCEDCYYGFLVVDGVNVMEGLWCSDCELVYECIDCMKCYDVRFVQNCENCVESDFLFDCRGVKNSMFCLGLRNKQYYLFNKQSSKEEVWKAHNYYFSGSYKALQEGLAKFAELKKEFPIRRANNFVSCENVVGDNIYNSRNIYQGFDIYESEDSAYVHDGLRARDCADISFFDEAELGYESTSLRGYGCRFTIFCRDSSDLFYCDNCHACRECFGCVGLRNKEFCVFNKQYSRSEYDELVPRIINHMGPDWGEFFPINKSFFAYNETLAHEYFPMTREEVLKKGWKWRDEDKKDYLEQSVEIPDNAADTDESICNEVLKCNASRKNYKIIPQEFRFYKKMGLPIPRLCPEERMKARLALRNPRRLWSRECAKCGKGIMTSYEAGRPERVYCEECYLETIN